MHENLRPYPTKIIFWF